jgi:hypothetical protein
MEYKCFIDLALPPLVRGPGRRLMGRVCRRRFAVTRAFAAAGEGHRLETHLTDITHVIQLAVAPVFLLTAIATLINALNIRLGRGIDRRRLILSRVRNQAGLRSDDDRAELALLSRRVRLIYFSLLAAGLGGLLICLVVAGAFVGALMAVDLSKAVAVFFILAMLAIVACLGMFLREVFLAVTGGTHRIP